MLSYNLFRVALIAIFALLLVRTAAADTIPATETMTNRYCLQMNSWCAASTNYVSRRFTKSEVCAWLDGVWPGNAPHSVIDTGGDYGYGICDSAVVGATDPSINISTPAIVYSCPANYSLDAGGTTCTSNPPACPAAGTNISSGFYDVGTVPTDLPGSFRLRCDSGCGALYSGGSIDWRVMVSGVYHYFVLGRFDHTGLECVTGEAAPGVVTALPTTSCGAGQSLVTGSGGFAKCYDNSTGIYTDSNSASAVAAQVAAGDAAYTAMMDSTAARITAMGGTASDVVAAQTVAAGVFAAGGSPGVSAAGTDEVMNAFCADNPTATVCAVQDFGTVEDVNLTENIVNVSISPVSVGGAGSCPAPSPFLLRGQTYYFVWDIYCNFATGIKPILLAFGWLAAAGILVGGFRS